MKLTLFLPILLLCLLASQKIYANNPEQTYRAVYELKEIYTYLGNDWEPDLNNKKSELKFRKDILRLELYPESSFCYSYYTWFTDSLKMQPDSDKIWMMLFKKAYDDPNRDSSQEPSYPHMRNKFQISKKYQEREMSIVEFLDGQYYEYKEANPDYNWIITDSVSNKNGYDCILATCNYGGRDWQVWFSTDLPWHDGPWKFSGLPGLIVSASDKDGLYSFDLKDIYAVSKPVKPWGKDFKATTRHKFLKEKFKYLKQLDGGALTAEFGIKVDLSPTKPRRYRVGIEKDYDYDK